MDPLSHALIGGLSAQTVGVSKKRFWLMVLLSNVPDLDVVASLLGSEAFIFQHRGVTHSFVGLLFQSIFWATLLARFDKGSFVQRVLHYSIPLSLHIFCDYLTCFGVPLFSPFSLKEYSFDLVGSVNVVPTLLTLFGVVWIYRKNKKGWRPTRLVWGMWAGFLLLSMAGKAYAGKILKDSLAVVMPATVGSFTWRAVQVDEFHRRYLIRPVNLFNGKMGPPSEVAMPDLEFPVLASMASPSVKRFLADYRWPVVQFSREGENWLVDWGTLLFSTRGLVRGKIRVEISPTGEILSEKRIFLFWDPKPIS